MNSRSYPALRFTVSLAFVFLFSILAPFVHAQEASVAEKVVNRFLATGQVSQRDLLLLMSQPKEFLRYQQALKAAAPELEHMALGIRRVVFQNALERLAAKAAKEGTVVQAVIALGSWADALNAGDMDIIVTGGQPAAKEFNQLLHEEVERIFRQEGDDVCREAFSKGARFTLETFEIYVSTLEDFGYETLKQAYKDAVAIAAKEGEAAGAAYLESAADPILRRNLNAQRFAAVQKEYYPGASGQDFVREYFNKKGKSRTWRVGDNLRTDDAWDKGMTVDKLKKAMIRDLGLSVRQSSGAFKFPVIADELVQWGERAKLGAREQAKGLVRAYEARPKGYLGLFTEEQDRLLRTARMVADAERENVAFIKNALRSNGFFTEEAFSQAGEAMLWDLTKASNNEAFIIIVDNQKAAIEATKAGRHVEAEYRRIKDYMMSNEQLAGYSKLKPEHLKGLAKDFEAQASKLSEAARKASYLDEMAALLEYMAEGTVKGKGQAIDMLVKLLDLAKQQKRLTSEVYDQAVALARAEKELPSDIEQVVAVLRRDLSDLASIRALSPASDTMANCIGTSSLFTKGQLVYTKELEELVTEIGKLSDVELLRLGFKNSEIALLKEINAAQKQGVRLAAVGEALKKASPKNWRTVLKGFIEEARKTAPGYLAFGSGFALWQVWKIANDPSIPESEQTKYLGDAIYGAFPTVGLMFDGIPMAAVSFSAGGEVDKAALAQGIGLSVLEIVGITNPVVGLTALAVYVGATVTVSMLQADSDRRFVQALYDAYDDNTLKIQGGGKRSFDVMGLQLLFDPTTRQPIINHSAAFKELYTKDGDVLLDTGEGRKPYDTKINAAIRDYAKRYVWDSNNDLKVWAQAVRNYFPGLDLDQVESWNLGEVSAQAPEVAANQFKVGARLVRRYLNQRDLLVEATLRQLRGRINDMKETVQSTDDWERELADIEKTLAVEGKIVPNAKAEQASFLGWAWDAATTPQTRIEQVGGIWKRYLKTYKEAVGVNDRVTKVFAAAGLEAPGGGDLFGIVGVEAKDKPKIDEVYQAFNETYDKAYQEYRGAKGSNPDPNDAYDADAFLTRLMSLRMRLFLAKFMPTTQARTASLEKDMVDLLEEVREHYKSSIDLTLTGPTQSEFQKDVSIEALAKAKTKAGEASLAQTRVEWYVNGKYYGQGSNLSFSPLKEGTYKVTAYLVTEMRGKRESIVSRDHTITIVPKKEEDRDKKPGDDDAASKITGEKKEDGKEEEKKQAVSCSYEYSEWGECSRATKKQTRTVTARKPANCVEKQKPFLEQGCTPPPTEEELKNRYLNCVCRCSSGWASHIGVWYDPEGKSKPECDSSGPCFGGAGAFGCTRRHFFGGPNDCVKACWEGVYGKDTYDPDKADKIRREENKKHKKPLKVTLKASKNPADFGDIINLQAEAADGTGGYVYTWGGCAQDAKAAQAKVVDTRDCKPCTASVTVTDQDGESASASVNIQCNTVKVKLTKESPKENTVPVGGKATFFAEVFSGDKPFSGPTLYYLWEHNPDALFGDPKNPSYETSGGAQVRNTATFRKVGTIPIWVTVLREIDGRKVTIGESEQIPITVGNPELTIKVTPEKPSVGQEVTLQVTTKPVIGDDIISFWWEIPGYWTGTGDKASFKPKDNKPVKATVHAKTKDGGDEVGTKDVTITPQSYEVTISEPRYLESPPQIWKCDTQLGGAQKCGMVTVKPTEFAVHRDLFMKATIKPAAESPRYRWTVDPSGSCGFPSSGSEIRINCSNTGTYTVTLEMTNADGAKLGKATQSVNVSISQATMEGSKKSQDAFDRLANAKNLVKEGKLDEGIALADEAARTDPKNTEAASLATRWKSERTQAMEHVANIKKLADTEKLDEAERELKAVKNLHPKYQPVADAEKLLAGKKDAQTKKTSQSAVLLEKARKEAHLGKLDEAMTSASEAAKVDPKNTEAAKYIDFIKKEKDAAAAGLEGVKKLMDDAKYQEASNALVPLKNKYAYYPPVQKMATELGEAWRSWDSKVKEAVGAVRMANERREFAKALELAKKAREMKPGPYLSTLAQQEEWAKRWEAEKEQKRRVLKSAEERLKNQDYDGAYKAFQEGFQNANNLWATSDPEPGYYGKLREEAFTKQKRIGELMAALRYAAEQTPVPPVDVLERGLKTAAEAAALQPGNGQIKTYENAITARIQKVKEDATRVTEAKKWRDQGEAQQKQNKITEAIASYRESLKYVPDKTLESHIAVLEGEAKKATDRKQNADRLWQEGSALISQGRPSDGLARLKESLQYGQDAERVRYVQDLEARKTKAQSLRDEGAKLQQQNLLKDAVARYNESLKYWPDSGLKAHIATLETKVSQNQETENRKAQARQLRDAAYALQQQNRVREAIGKYRESLNVWPDPKLEDYVRQLEASLAGPAGTPSSSGQTPVPVSSQAGWSGTWKATGKDREEVIFALTQSGNRLSGTYTVLVSFSSGLKETLNGRLDGTVSGNRASGKWGDGKDSRTLGTFDATMASGSNSFRVTIKDADSTDTYTAVRRAGQAVPAASTGRMYTGSWSNAPRKGGVLFNNGNISGVSNNPTRATVFSLAKPHVITLIENYHWNNGRGTTSAGSIGLRGSDGRTYGPWAVSGHPGQGGVPNAYWRCQPNVALPAGTYTVVDSDPATWSQNSGSQGSGHTRVEGYPAN